MKLSISNIAWDVAEDAQVASLLQQQGVSYIDVAPSKYFPSFADASQQQVLRVRAWWAERGIALAGMQSLLYGTQGLNVFAALPVQERMLAHLDQVCRIGALLGAPKLVFGSPKNRDKTGLSDAEALEIASVFFRRAGEKAAAWGVTLCLEPNPEIYGCNFMTTFASTAAVVAAVDHPHVRMQLDTGALAVSQEPLEPFLRAHAAMVGHVHLSEPHLVPLGQAGTRHADYGPLLAAYLPDWVATVEMLSDQGPARLQTLRGALRTANKYYAAPLPAAKTQASAGF